MKQMSPKGKKILAACILVVLAVAITLVSTFAVQHANGPAKVVKTFFHSFNDRDFEAFCGCYLPKDQPLIRQAAERLGGSNDFFDQNYHTMFGEGTPYAQFGTDIKLSVSDISTQEQTIENGYYSGVDVHTLKVSAVSTVECSVTTKGSISEITERLRVVCFKSEGKWYIYTMANIPDENTVTNTDAQ